MGKYFHPKCMATIMFALDIVYGIFHEIISLFSVSRGTAIATVSFFILSGVGTFILAIGFFLFSERPPAAVFSWILHLILVCMYYYGKNIKRIMHRYGDELGCGEKCTEVNENLAVFCLTLSAFLLLSFIPQLHHYVKEICTKCYHTYWHYFNGTILIMVSANAVYSTASLALIDRKCSDIVLALTVILVVSLTIVGWLSIFMTDDLWEGDLSVRCWSAYIALGLILPLYLICDNRLPLEYISCRFSNSSLEAVSEEVYSGDESEEMVSGVEYDHLVPLVGYIIIALVVPCIAVILYRRARAALK